jgi:hypothetical protein
MKKILIIAAVAGLTMVSCKKERTCTCNVTFVSSTTNGVANPLPTGTITMKKKSEKVSKAGAHCNSGEQTETQTYTAGGTTYTDIDVYKADCTLD